MIDNIGADANVLGETVIYEKDNKFFTYDNSGKLIDEGNLPDKNQKGFLENQKDKLIKTLDKIEQSLADPDASRPTGLEELEQPIIAYLQGRVDLGDLSLADQGKVMSKEFQDAMRDKKVAPKLVTIVYRPADIASTADIQNVSSNLWGKSLQRLHPALFHTPGSLNLAHFKKEKARFSNITSR